MNQLDRVESGSAAILTSERILLAEARLNAHSKGSSSEVSKDSIVRRDGFAKLSQAFPAFEVLRVKCKSICFGSVIVHDIVYFNCCLRLVPAGRREGTILALRLDSAPDAALTVTVFVDTHRRERAVATIRLIAAPDACVHVGRMTMTLVRRERT
jgi:hypothetical protein